MSEIYLQRKVEPVADKYIIVGNNYRLVAGDIPVNNFPKIEIFAPPGSSFQVLHYSAGVQTYPVVGENNKWECTPTVFGFWKINCLNNGQLLASDIVKVTSIGTYTVDFISILSYPGSYSGETYSGEGVS